MTAHNDRYGWPHRRERARWAHEVATGLVPCARCHGPIASWESWDLDHADSGGIREYIGASHARCNRDTARRGVTATAPESPRSVWSRHWAGGFDERCRACAALGAACADASVEEARS